MKIGVISSMQNSEKMLEVCRDLEKMGHVAFASKFAPSMVGKSDEEKEEMKLNQKYNMDAIREFWNLMQNADAVLVLNLDKNGMKNYVGGNTFLEMGFAHVLNQKIYMYNPIPENPFYQTEIVAMNPVIINRDLNLIK